MIKRRITVFVDKNDNTKRQIEAFIVKGFAVAQECTGKWTIYHITNGHRFGKFEQFPDLFAALAAVDRLAALGVDWSWPDINTIAMTHPGKKYTYLSLAEAGRKALNNE